MAVDYAPMFYWVRERERIRIAHDAGEPMPWTTDPILAKYRFCNVRREDDLVTVFIRKHIRTAFHNHPHLWLMLCIARQLNWPATLAELIDHHAWPDNPDFSPELLKIALQARKARKGEKVYTGAYMISAPATKGADKQGYIADVVIGDLWNRREVFERNFASKTTLQRTHELITRTNGWGPFMAYQAVVDMRFTALLENAEDVSSWAAAGPGTLRGLNRIHGRETDAPLSQGKALREMLDIYKVVQQETGVELDFSDVPNLLCETDKYLRVKNGEGKPRALYVAGRGS